jgi:protein-S-isoprenylcysteine O-methyltransferase Ste14
LRNPIYVFAELLFIGAAVFLWSWGPLLIALLVLPVQIVRARKEAAVLQSAFGDDYTRYRRQTWF